MDSMTFKQFIVGILVLAAILLFLSSCGKKKSTKTFEIYRGIVISPGSGQGQVQPVYITGADTMVYAPGDTVMVDKHNNVDHDSEEPDHQMVLGVFKGVVTEEVAQGTAD